MVTTSEWNKIREGLQAQEPQELRRAAVRVGKIKAENLPDDIEETVIGLFSHPDPDMRAEAIRALGLHWRLAGTVKPIADVLRRDDDWHVQISAISALGALGLEHTDCRCVVSKVLAGVVLDERFADNERMIAYLELSHIEGKIGTREYLAQDRGLPGKMADFEIDHLWVEELMRRECPELWKGDKLRKGLTRPTS